MNKMSLVLALLLLRATSIAGMEDVDLPRDSLERSQLETALKESELEMDKISTTGHANGEPALEPHPHTPRELQQENQGRRSQLGSTLH